eukprot:Nk52_evm45s215 gene=Nk52_evmTU45s215
MNLPGLAFRMDFHYWMSVMWSIALLINFTLYYLFAWVIVMPMYLVGLGDFMLDFANKVFTYNLTLPSLVIQYWTGLRFMMYNGEGFPMPAPKEKSLTIVNHESFLDGPILTILQHVCGCMDSVRYILWDHVMSIPFGWASKFVGHIMITCKWDKDQQILHEGFENFAKQPFLNSIAFFPEGYVKTKKSMKKCQDFCRDNNMPVLKYTLWPRVKGFYFCLERLREFQKANPDVPCYVNDITSVYPGYVETGPSFFEIFTYTKQGMELHFVTDKFKISDIPETEEGVKKWIEQRYMHKEKLLEYFHKNGCFPENSKTYGGLNTKSAPGTPKEHEFPLLRNIVWSVVWIGLAWLSVALFLLLFPFYLAFFSVAILYYHGDKVLAYLGMSGASRAVPVGKKSKRH